jgi:hypothetical protein
LFICFDRRITGVANWHVCQEEEEEERRRRRRRRRIIQIQ